MYCQPGSNAQQGVFTQSLKCTSTRTTRPRAAQHASRAQPSDDRLASCTVRPDFYDFYALLEVNSSATAAEMKQRYRALQKKCHPDIMQDEDGHRLSVLINEAYAVLSDERLRSLYDVDLRETLWEEEQGFRNEARSEWVPHTAPESAKNEDPEESRALFVDEIRCIGCKKCAWLAPSTFVIEADHGRARAVRQWADTEDDMKASVMACPVDCIHFVQREQLPILEHVMAQHKERVNVGVMRSSNLQSVKFDVFHEARILQQHEAQRKKAHHSWQQVYNYTKQQEEAMAHARARGFGGPAFASGLSMFGKLVGLLAAAMKTVKLHQANSRTEEQEYFGDSSVPLERALVRVRVHDDDPSKRL